MTTEPIRQPGQLLTEILTWCVEHPWAGDDLTPGDITFQQHYSEADGTRTVSIMGTPPQVMAVSVALLDQADPQLLEFERGLLVLDVQPQRVLYEPLYVGYRVGLIDVILFRYVCSRCHNSRKVPDWSQGLDPVYGEPKGKPCPECLEWPR